MKRFEETTLDDKGLRARACWWLQHCNHLYAAEYDSEYLGLHKTRRAHPMTVSEYEARYGQGRRCKVCGLIWGSYVCDGLPTFQATTVLPLGEREAMENQPTDEDREEIARLTKIPVPDMTDSQHSRIQFLMTKYPKAVAEIFRDGRDHEGRL